MFIGSKAVWYDIYDDLPNTRNTRGLPNELAAFLRAGTYEWAPVKSATESSPERLGTSKTGHGIGAVFGQPSFCSVSAVNQSGSRSETSRSATKEQSRGRSLSACRAGPGVVTLAAPVSEPSRATPSISTAGFACPI